MDSSLPPLPSSSSLLLSPPILSFLAKLQSQASLNIPRFPPPGLATAPPLGLTTVPPASIASTTHLDRHYTCQERLPHSSSPPVHLSSVNMTDDGTVWSIMFVWIAIHVCYFYSYSCCMSWLYFYCAKVNKQACKWHA